MKARVNASGDTLARIRELEAALAVYRDAESIWRARVAELEQRLATVTAAFDREIEPREREAD